MGHDGTSHSGVQNQIRQFLGAEATKLANKTKPVCCSSNLSFALRWGLERAWGACGHDPEHASLELKSHLKVLCCEATCSVPTVLKAFRWHEWMDALLFRHGSIGPKMFTRSLSLACQILGIIFCRLAHGSTARDLYGTACTKLGCKTEEEICPQQP